MHLFLLLLYSVACAVGLLLTWPLMLLGLALLPKLRAGLWQKLGYFSPEQQRHCHQLNRMRPVVWFHAVSVGELLAIAPVLEHLLAEQKLTLVVSTTTRTGATVVQERFASVLGTEAMMHLYFPLDVPWAIQSALKWIRPDKVVFVETELWPWFTYLARYRYGVRLMNVNARLSPRSFRRYRWLASTLMPRLLGCFEQVFAQSPQDAERFKELGMPPERLQVLGNLKFDAAISTRVHEQVEQLRPLLGFQPTHKVLVIASTHAGEDEALIPMFKGLLESIPELRIVLAPRHPERVATVKKLLSSEVLPFSLRSHLTPEQPNTQPIVLLNTVGELMATYVLGDVALVGGSFVGVGGHNILEPLIAGKPVLFGPMMHNFTLIRQLVLDAEAGIELQTPKELPHRLMALLSQPDVYADKVKRGKACIELFQGNKQRFIKALYTSLGI